MKPRIVVIEDLPPPDTINPAAVFMDDTTLMICYGSGEEEFAVLTFSGAFNVKMGGPNDEALHGHPLYHLGLKHYSIHRVENSPWLHELERQNSVHPYHTPTWFLKDKVHYLLALKECTVECIVAEPEGARPLVEMFPTRRSAMERLKNGIDA